MGVAGLIRVTECPQVAADSRELAVHIAAIYSPAHNQMVTTPGMVGTVAVGVKGPGEVRRRKGCHRAAHIHATDIGQSCIKCGHCIG